jgi:hypothetical protein
MPPSFKLAVIYVALFTRGRGDAQTTKSAARQSGDCTTQKKMNERKGPRQGRSPTPS